MLPIKGRKRSNRVAVPDKPLAIIKVAFGVLTVFWTFLFNQTIQIYNLNVLLSPSSGTPVIQLYVYAPHYLSQNEDERLRFAIENTDSEDTHVSLLLTNSNSGNAFMGINDSNLIYSGIISPQQQINRELKIFFPVDLEKLGKPVSLNIVTRINQELVEKTELQLDISLIPFTKRVSTLLSAMWLGVFSWLFKEEWKKLRELGVKST